jgi:tetratricopeptide (TPR) repeat protein
MRTALVLLMLCSAAVVRGDEADAKRLMELATVAHKRAQQTKDVKDYEKAAGLYQQYFAKADHPDEHAMSFYYAELLFRLQRYDEAAKYYDRTITVDPRGKYADEAAYALVISTKNAVKTPDPKPDSPPPCPEMKPCPIPADLQRLLAAFDRYLATVAPTAKDRATMEYRRARLYYDYQHFAEAAPIFDHIVAAYPDNELAIYAANLEMDCLTIAKRYEPLRTLVERVKKSPTLMKDETTQKQVRDVEDVLKKKGK